jgi:hypothetical protein
MPISLDHALHWLSSPLSGADSHHLDGWIVWHARLMVLAWAVLLPLGAIAARYYKVTPKQDWPRELDNRAWWHAHRSLQYSAALIMLAGLALVWKDSAPASTPAILHTYLGWGVLALGLVQLISAWLRGSKGGPTGLQMRGDHYDMTAHRRWFERIHKICGWTAVCAAVLTVILGLWAADAPRWMALVLSAWWLALLGWGVRLERAGRCIDTYQAIWGPDLKHPGNQRAQPGWGMLRPHDHRERL